MIRQFFQKRKKTKKLKKFFLKKFYQKKGEFGKTAQNF